MDAEIKIRDNERAIIQWSTFLGIPASWARQYVYERGNFPKDLATFQKWLDITGKRDPKTGALRPYHRRAGGK